MTSHLKSPVLFSVFWPVLIGLEVLDSSSNLYFLHPMRTVLSVPITVGISVINVFNIFFSALTKSKYLSIFSLSLFSFCGLLERQNPRDNKFYLFSFFFFFFWLLINTTTGFLALSDSFVSIENETHKNASHFLGTDSSFCIYHLVNWSNFNFFAQFPEDHLS